MADYEFYVGVDSGLTGAIVMLDRKLQVFDYGRMPTIQKKGNPTVKAKIDALKLRDGILATLDKHAPAKWYAAGVCCFIEDPGIIPSNGPFRIASQQHSLATIESVLLCLGFDVRLVGAQKWKGQYNLPGGKENKKQAIQFALRLNPELGILQISDADIAEALLIARYGCKYILGVNPQED